MENWNGQCTVGSFDLSVTVGNHIFDTIINPNIHGFTVLSPYANETAALGTNSAGTVIKIILFCCLLYSYIIVL